MVYKKEPELNDIGEFRSKDEFINDARQYCFSDSFEEESAYEKNGNQITIK